MIDFDLNELESKTAQVDIISEDRSVEFEPGMAADVQEKTSEKNISPSIAPSLGDQPAVEVSNSQARNKNIYNFGHGDGYECGSQSSDDLIMNQMVRKVTATTGEYLNPWTGAVLPVAEGDSHHNNAPDSPPPYLPSSFSCIQETAGHGSNFQRSSTFSAIDEYRQRGIPVVDVRPESSQKSKDLPLVKPGGRDYMASIGRILNLDTDEGESESDGEGYYDSVALWKEYRESVKSQLMTNYKENSSKHSSAEKERSTKFVRQSVSQSASESDDDQPSVTEDSSTTISEKGGRELIQICCDSMERMKINNTRVDNNLEEIAIDAQGDEDNITEAIDGASDSIISSNETRDNVETIVSSDGDKWQDSVCKECGGFINDEASSVDSTGFEIEESDVSMESTGFDSVVIEPLSGLDPNCFASEKDRLKPMLASSKPDSTFDSCPEVFSYANNIIFQEIEQSLEKPSDNDIILFKHEQELCDPDKIPRACYSIDQTDGSDENAETKVMEMGEMLNQSLVSQTFDTDKGFSGNDVAYSVSCQHPKKPGKGMLLESNSYEHSFTHGKSIDGPSIMNNEINILRDRSSETPVSDIHVDDMADYILHAECSDHWDWVTARPQSVLMSDFNSQSSSNSEFLSSLLTSWSKPN